MDDAIDHLAQLCSTDPLTAHMHIGFKSDHNLKGHIVIFFSLQ